MLLKKQFRFFFSLFLGIVLTGCSSTNKLYMETLRLAFFQEPPTFSLEEVRARDIDLLKVVHGERQPAFLALAYIEGGLHKWVSADQSLLLMDNNKLFRTAGLATNLQNTENIIQNPLRHIDALNGYEWQYSIDVSDTVYALPVTSKWETGEAQQATFFNQPLTVIPVTETVTVPVNQPYWHSEQSWQNIYWLEAKTKQVVYSQQLATPYSELMTMTYVSRIARLLNSEGGEE